MAVSITTDNNTIYREDVIVIGQTIQTTDATPTVIYSYPTLETFGYKVNISYGAGSPTSLNKFGGDLLATHGRITGGNITKLANDMYQELTSFSGVIPPSIRTVANASTQTIDIEITGVAATTLLWTIKIDIKRRTN